MKANILSDFQIYKSLPLMSYFISITFHVFNFSFKLSTRPSNFEKRYKIYVITVLGTYMKP